MRALIFIFLSFCTFTLHAQIPSFPGAEGGGKYTSGGRFGKVIYVDNLNNKGKGSLRKAIEAEGPRIILFKVSGNIELEKPIYIKNGDLTIAGQSAPGDGICLKNYGVRIEADNVIIRYIRVRPGDVVHEEMDAITGTNNKNIMIDHCSFSWSNDEVASFYDNENFTMQWCIISESFFKSYHHKGNHGYGGIWGGFNATFHHNLISDHTSRNPRFQGSRYTLDSSREFADFRNNVIYNWGYNSSYGGEEGHYNIVNNYYKAGPATKKDVRDRILNLTQVYYTTRGEKDTLGAGKFYISGNVVDGYPMVNQNNWKYGVQGKGVTEDIKSKSKLNKPVKHTKIKTDKALDAYQKIINEVGASYKRDGVDMRIIDELKSASENYGKTFDSGGKGIIDSQEDVGGWPFLKTTEAPQDTDNDGIPDEWEKSHGLNPSGIADGNEISISKKYTNLEVYLNSILN